MVVIDFLYMMFWVVVVCVFVMEYNDHESFFWGPVIFTDCTSVSFQVAMVASDSLYMMDRVFFISQAWLSSLFPRTMSMPWFAESSPRLARFRALQKRLRCIYHAGLKSSSRFFWLSMENLTLELWVFGYKLFYCLVIDWFCLVVCAYDLLLSFHLSGSCVVSFCHHLNFWHRACVGLYFFFVFELLWFSLLITSGFPFWGVSYLFRLFCIVFSCLFPLCRYLTLCLIVL